MNLPNSITLSRIASIPVFIWILSSNYFSSETGAKELAAAGLFLAASLTDSIDGWLARRRGQITPLGMLLDPLADKLMVAAAFITLAQFHPRMVPAWIAVVIIGREFLVSGLRTIAANQGFTIEASDLGKFKMVVQIISVVAVVLDHRWSQWDLHRIGVPIVFSLDLVARFSVGFMTAISLASAADYFIGFWSKISRSVEKRKRRFFVLRRRKKENLVVSGESSR